MEINSYAAPDSQVFQATSADELTRKTHIGTEDAIKSLSILYFFAAPVLIALGAAPFASHVPYKTTPLLLAGGLLLMGIAVAFTAYGLSRLQSWARITTIILTGIAIIILPRAIPMHIYVIVKMLGKQTQFVMTPEYQRIIEATPYVKRKSSIGMRVLLALLLIILIAAVNLRQ